jgi:hypothetical protein
MIKALFDSLKQQSELMLKYKDGTTLDEIEVYLFAKINIRLLREELQEQIAFDAYWEREYEQRRNDEKEKISSEAI